MRPNHVSLVAAATCTAIAGAASAAINITQSTTVAPTYGTTLNFDEPGTPTGTVASNSFASYGIANFGTGDNINVVDIGAYNTAPGYSWLGTGNSAHGSYGLYLNFSSQLSAFSCQYWDDSGPGSFFGGGAAVIALLNGVEVGSLFLNNPAFSSTGKSWINVTTTGGTTFDEIRLVGFGFFPQAYADNLSWNTVPAPSAAGLLALSGIVVCRRRRA